MDVNTFLGHHGVRENPFGAEEARHDPVFLRLSERSDRSHPDFDKILGSLDRPSTSIVFGEKGSGKTAIRLLIARRVARHNEDFPEARALLVAYDDLNPVIDLVARNRGTRRRKTLEKTADAVFKHFRLEEHQDAILGLAVTKLVDGILGDATGEERLRMPSDIEDRLKRMPRRQRVDLAMLAALYDQPRGGGVLDRFARLRRKLHLGFRFSLSWLRTLAVLATIPAVGLWLVPLVSQWLLDGEAPDWALPAAGILSAVAFVLWTIWSVRLLSLWSLVRKIRRETPAIDRGREQLQKMLSELRRRDRTDQPWPIRGGEESNARYELTAKLLRLLDPLGFAGMIVLVDRVDEPTLVGGEPERMKALVWPMLDSKFLQQDQVGFKLLLPIELRYLVHRESADFFQEARLDKQNLVDRLTWSGATLYDLCTARLRACQPEGESPVSLTDLFTADVGRSLLVESLDQMHQPRDAFKFLYSVIQEHCRLVPEEEPQFEIPRLTLESVRRDQVRRIQDLQRGLSPA